jgi:hypothetical protein
VLASTFGPDFHQHLYYLGSTTFGLQIHYDNYIFV